MSLAGIRWRVVVDTNVLISGLLFGGKPAAILDLALGQAFVLLTSPVMEIELIRVLTRKFNVSNAGVTGIVALIRSTSESIRTETKLLLCRDESDNRILECALEGDAGFIVTGDNDLLSLSPFPHSVILRPDEFLTRFYAAHPGL
jgi:putative PIN family toxin of toxin-antitoxin system